MKVSIGTPTPGTDQPHRLFLEPETDKDREVLAELARSYLLTNYGIRHNTGAPLHAGIELKPKAQP